jgi:hypothetical protein
VKVANSFHLHSKLDDLMDIVQEVMKLFSFSDPWSQMIKRVIHIAEPPSQNPG